MGEPKADVSEEQNEEEVSVYLGLQGEQADEISAHDQYTNAYINILDIYKDNLDSSMEYKRDFKKEFFTIIKRIMYILIVVFILSLIVSFLIFVIMVLKNYKSTTMIAGAITTVISSFVTMAVSIYELPKIITEYLFNKEEDTLMSEIIKNIQNYEIENRKLDNSAVVNAAEKKKIENRNSIPPFLDGHKEHPDDAPAELEQGDKQAE